MIGRSMENYHLRGKKKSRRQGDQLGAAAVFWQKMRRV